jgi:tetratricopeptide (TPR) repeat protein
MAIFMESSAFRSGASLVSHALLRRFPRRERSPDLATILQRKAADHVPAAFRAKIQPGFSKNGGSRLAQQLYGLVQPMLVNTIEFPDKHFLRAAEGWAELLAFDEVAHEVAKVRPQFRNHPEVLEVRWAIAANACQWPQALLLAKKLARLAPKNPKGWTYEANSFIELQRPSEAYSLLLKAQQRFPRDENVAYDLGCVCCILERLEEASRWIRQAIELGGVQVELEAMEDPELQAMWKDLRGSRRCHQPGNRPDHVS